MTDIAKVSNVGKQIISEVERAVVGKRELLEMIMASVLAGGHILLEDYPGLGKTLIARSFAAVLALDFKRIQFTADLLPGDITGGYIFNRGLNQFELRKGPLFANIVLADEINRASPKTQSALLEAMQEQSVTVANQTYHLDLPFFVLATQNPLEMEGTYPLPEAQLDRFFFKVNVSYPSGEDLVQILNRTTRSETPAAALPDADRGAGDGRVERAGRKVHRQGFIPKPGPRAQLNLIHDLRSIVWEPDGLWTARGIELSRAGFPLNNSQRNPADSHFCPSQNNQKCRFL